MKKLMLSIIAVCLIIATLACFFVASAAPSIINWKDSNTKKPQSYTYSFVLVPDTQILASFDAVTELPYSSFPSNNKRGKNYMKNVYKWIVDNEEAKNIKHVFGLGDITQTDHWLAGMLDETPDINAAIDAEWAVAKAAIAQLNVAGIPYSMVRGNHDNVDRFKAAFNTEVYKSQFEGFYDKTPLNSYRTMNVCGIDYLFVTLDYRVSDDVLDWANELIARYPEHRVIISTHELLGGGSNGFYGDGERYWNELLRKHENIFMTFCGHIGSQNMYMQKRTGDHGNNVYSILSDYQDYDSEIEPVGVINVLYFDEDNGKVWMEDYSTVKKKFNINPQYNFKFKTLNMQTVVTTTPAPTTAPPTYVEDHPCTTTAPTDFVTEPTTIEPTTEAPSSVATTASPTTMTTTAAEQGGCGSMVIGMFTALPVIACASAMTVRKKNKKI